MRRRHRGVIPQLGLFLWRAVRWVVTRPALWVLLMVGVGGGSGMWYLLTQTEAFRIARIEAPHDLEIALPNDLIGRNLWTVDLQQLTSQLKARHPHLKRIRVLRRLPQTLVIDVLARMPVGQVKQAKASGAQWHPVDREGMLLPSVGRLPSKDLVVLKGIGGEEDRRRAVRIAERLQRHPALIGHRVTSVDLQDPHRLIVVLDEAMEIRLGPEDQLAQQLTRLRIALNVITQHSVDVSYIDVRFEEPVIGQKVAKK